MGDEWALSVLLVKVTNADDSPWRVEARGRDGTLVASRAFAAYGRAATHAMMLKRQCSDAWTLAARQWEQEAAD